MRATQRLPPPPHTRTHSSRTLLSPPPHPTPFPRTCQQWVSAPTSGYKCPAGTYWNSGATASTSKCFTCNPGKFATCSNGVDGAGSSAACHSSTGCSTIGAGNFATNLIKSPSTGTVWSFTTDAAGNAYAGAQKIAQCGYGTYNAGNNNFCSNCVTVAGKYCNVGASSAAGTACPAGSYCVAGTVKTAPPSCTGGAGRYCPAGSSTANGAACPSGMYCAGGSAAPVAACAASANYFCASAGATPALCSTAEGYYCPAGSASSAGVECPSGKYCAGGATAPVTSCSAAPGYYCATPGATTPTLCPAGSYCTGYTAGPLNCLYLGLAVGRHCPAGTSSTAGEACPVGYFCDGAGGSVACTAATNRYCASGLESLPATSTAGVLCAGTTSATSTTLTTAFTDATGTQSGTFHVCKGGSSAPIPRYCPAGYWHAGGYGFGSVNRWLPATLTADTACVACTSDVTCKTGVYYSATPEQGSAVNPLVLSSGYSTCSNGNTAFGYAGGQFCGPCPAGFYCRTSALGNIVASNILSPGKPLPCSPGTFCPMGNYYGASYTPGPGMYASFCPAGTYAVTVTVAAGEVAGSTHAGDVYACSNCAAGTYSVAGGECLPCAGTAFSTPGSASCSYTSATCPAGTKYNLLTNACEPCPDGYNNSYTGQAACAKAPAGHFAFSSGGTPAALYVPLRGMANAVQCPAGTYTNVAGASKCTPCPADSYAVKGSSMCTICPDGKRVAYGLGTSANSCYY